MSDKSVDTRYPTEVRDAFRSHVCHYYSQAPPEVCAALEWILKDMDRRALSPHSFKLSMQLIQKAYSEPDDSHVEADKLMMDTLMDLGYGEGIAVFAQMKKWYS